jgi:transcriptional regulator with XRE-family HTH domain
MGDMREFGNSIRKWRIDRGFIRALDFASAIGLAQSGLSRLESGETKTLPPPETVKRISEVLDVPVSELLSAAGYVDVEHSADPDDSPRVREYTEKVRRIDWDQPGRARVFEHILNGWLEDDRKQREGK